MAEKSDSCIKNEKKRLQHSTRFSGHAHN